MSTAPAEPPPPRDVFGTLRRRALAANLVGATIAFVYLTVVSPPQPPPPHDEWAQLGLAPIYVALAALVGNRIARPRIRAVAEWLEAGRPPTREERALVLGLPRQAAALSAAGWLLASVVFGVVTATHHPVIYVAGVVLGIQLAGLTTAAATYLLAERSLRRVFALAFAGALPPHGNAEPIVGTRPRLLVSWALGSGVALVAIAVAFLGRGDERGDDLVGAVLFLVVAGLFAGGVLIAAAARSISEPVERLRAAVERVEEGSLDEEVVVDDGGEIGSLQAGFNRMVAGLRERERIRETFGTYVDPEVAEHILSEGTKLDGEEVEVTLMFIDVRDFTGYAERASAREVVTTINRLFERAVPIVHAHKGHVDKFVGDGLLAVFGAPRRCEDHADQALAAAREIEQAVRADLRGELEIGVGLDSGVVVAGNVGGAGRFEFSVIGDAVNVAARVEAATRQTGDTVLLTERTRELLQDSSVPLAERPGVALKGKSRPVAVYAPEHARVAGRSDDP
ncbi:MAG TPA: adenylate/guanylate cyclase domain-containing protein [Solirubrobacteraceae bacterium]|nr:adenylate/guanylate cyclase domain-containing protein [Solirubrobacteraceae bacterium]